MLASEVRDVELIARIDLLRGTFFEMSIEIMQWTNVYKIDASIHFTVAQLVHVFFVLIFWCTFLYHFLNES